MPTFRKKPVEVEAFRLGKKGHPTPAPAWFGSPDRSAITEDGILIPTLEGVMLAGWGDWIIRGTRGEIYPCKAEIFPDIYELVTK
jgi:hypothetical protein